MRLPLCAMGILLDNVLLSILCCVNVDMQWNVPFRKRLLHFRALLCVAGTVGVLFDDRAAIWARVRRHSLEVLKIE